jgi:ribonuclease P protein component
MKSKIAALSKNKDFKDLLKGKRVSNKYLTIYFANLLKKENKKLNISFVAKKKLGNAIKRNKIKRRLRNIVDEAVKKISLNFNYSYLVIAKVTMLDNEYIKIKESVFEDFKRIK